MRTRVFKDHTEGQVGYFYRLPAYHGDTVFPSVTVSKDYSMMQDVVVPDFFSRLRRGELIINPLYKETEEISCGGGSLSMFWPHDPAGFSGSYVGPSITQHIGFMYGCSWTLPDVTLTDRSADAKLNALQGILAPKARLMEDIIEMRQTIATLGNPLRSIREVAHEISKRRVTDGAAKAWLAYAMELRPLYQSLCDLHDGLLHQGGQFNAGTRLRAAGIAFSDANGAKTEAHTSYNVTYSTSLNVHVKWRAIVYYRVKTPVKVDLQQYLGLRARDVPTGVWNAVGYSFLVDRVANVSRSLNALTNLMDPNVVVEGGCITRDENRVETAQAVHIDNSPDMVRNLSGDLWTRTTSSRKRDYWSPSVVDLPPPVNIGGLVDSATKVLDLAALAQQALRRAVPRHNQKLLAKNLKAMSRKGRRAKN